MTVYDRFMMELSNQPYMSEVEFKQLIAEQDLVPEDEYVKSTMQKQLLFACIEALEAVCNDIDTMTAISTEFGDIGQAYQFLEARIVNLKDKIASIPDEEEEYSAFSLMFTRGGSKTYGGVISGIDKSKIDSLD